MKQRDVNIESFLKYGIAESIAIKLVEKNYTVTKVRAASKKDFDKILNDEEVDDLFLKIKRQPIPDEVFERLVTETELHCCFCWDISKENPVIIHHIDEYNKTQDNSFNNLIVLCLNHHGEVHTKREISQQNYPKILLLSQKEKWIKALIEYRAGKRPAPGSETKATTQTVTNSPNSINTQNQVGDNFLVNASLKPHLEKLGVPTFVFDEKTKLFSTKYNFGSKEGLSLNNIEIEIHFDQAFEIVKSGISGSGMVSSGKFKRIEDPLKKWYKFSTTHLLANNYVIIEVFSRNILKDEKLYIKP